MHNHERCHKPKRRAGVRTLLATLLSGAVCMLLCPQAIAATPAPEELKRGEMLVLTLGCHDCHTPLKMGAQGPEPDMSRMLSGHPEQLKLPPPPKMDVATWAWVGSATNTAFAGPWGISYAANLTADADTGLGKWTEQMFIACDQDRQAPRHLAADHAADAVAGLFASVGEGSQGGVRVPPHGSGDP